MSLQCKTVAAFFVMIMLGFVELAQTQVIGNWESGSGDGWIDWGNGLSVTDPSNAAKYSFSTTTGVTLGSESLHVSNTGYQQNLALKLENQAGGVAAFLANTDFLIDVTYPAQSLSSGYSQIYDVVLYAQDYGFNSLTFNPVPGSGVGYGGPTGDIKFTLDFSYASALAANGGAIAANPNFVEFMKFC